MNISPSIKILHALATHEAIRRRHGFIEQEHIMLALLRLAQLAPAEVGELGLEGGGLAEVSAEFAELSAEFARRGHAVVSASLRLGELLGQGEVEYRGGQMHRSPECRRLFERATQLARTARRTLRSRQFLEALLAEPTPLIALMSIPTETLLMLAPTPATEVAGETPPGSGEINHLVRLTARLRGLRADLLARIFGQDHAIEAFIDGLFNAEITAEADQERRAPRALFVFAGPPGVGKTYLAESGATALERPFKRFDMSAFSGHHQGETLVGIARNYQGAQPGLLTGFVDQHPDAVLLFDEIEKAHLNTIHYFLQLLDAGRLEDKFHGRDIAFRDTTIIFTTNVGRKLYDNPDRSGIHGTQGTQGGVHRRTVIDALASEINPATRAPFFPEAICSRMATGYPILFNHLGVNELSRVAAADIVRTAGLLAGQLGKRIEFDPVLPLLLVMKEGGRSDARTLRAQTGAFIKNEVFKLARLFSAERLGEALQAIDTIRFEVDAGAAGLDPAIATFLQPTARPRILAVGAPALAERFAPLIADFDWRFADCAETALAALAEDEPDFAMIDLWLGAESAPFAATDTIAAFDHAPLAARSLERGQELLRKLHERAPGLAVILLVFDGEGARGRDEELLAACIRAGGARAAVTCRLGESGLQQFRADLAASAERLARERSAEVFGRERQQLFFDTAPSLDNATHTLSIRMRNLRMARAIAANDAGDILEDVERPQTIFDDVIGADSAKEELRFFIDYLKNPRRFAALGLKPPKGILLYGPPGTGKTMLARAMAGESAVAYLPATASSFVTMWQGSGPENVRKLFERARRYAPAIVFIDEIDAIGKMRTGNPSGHGEEMALNALLTEMDGFSGQAADRPVFVLAATNFRVDADEGDAGKSGRVLDPALVRRFSRSILVALPDTAARRRYFVQRLGAGEPQHISAGTLDLLAEKSVGMSIANLEQVLEAAGRNAFRSGLPLTDELLLEALDTVREGEAKEWMPDLLEGTAWHEAGHTLMYWLAGWWSPEVSIVARAARGGGMRRAAAEIGREARTQTELLAEIRTALGGRVAEMLHFGDAAGLTTGASGDLDHASSIARQMICRYGMDEAFGPAAMNEMLSRPEALGTPLYREIQQRVAGILKEQEALTRVSLEQQRTRLDAVAEALLHKNRLLQADLEALLGAPPAPDGRGKAATNRNSLNTTMD